MESNYAQTYKRLYNEHWWWRAREKFIINILDHLPLAAEADILDIGCGDGLFFETLSRYGRTVEGLESNAELLSESTTAQYRIHVGPFDPTYAPGKRFDLIVMLDVLEHLPEPASAMRQIRDLLKPGGIVLVTVPAFRCLWTTHDDMNHHYTRFTKGTLRPLFDAAQLQILKERYFFHWLFAVKLAVRLKEQIRRADVRLPAVPIPAVNRFMRTLSTMEHRLLRPISMPFGSSLLFVGQQPGPRS